MKAEAEIVAPRARNREKTESELRLSLHRLERRGGKISIAAVAEGAGVSPALLHNRYPEIAEDIRALIGKSSRKQRDSKNEELIQERAKNRQLREQIAELMAEIVKLASVNEAVRAELSLLKAMADRKVVRLSAGSGR